MPHAMKGYKGDCLIWLSLWDFQSLSEKCAPCSHFPFSLTQGVDRGCGVDLNPNQTRNSVYTSSSTEEPHQDQPNSSWPEDSWVRKTNVYCWMLLRPLWLLVTSIIPVKTKQNLVMPICVSKVLIISETSMFPASDTRNVK